MSGFTAYRDCFHPTGVCSVNVVEGHSKAWKHTKMKPGPRMEDSRTLASSHHHHQPENGLRRTYFDVINVKNK